MDIWKTGRDDMQSYDGLTGEPFTNIYHATETDGIHPRTGETLPKVMGRAVGPDNKRTAKLFAAAPVLRDLLDTAVEYLESDDRESVRRLVADARHLLDLLPAEQRLEGEVPNG